DRIGVTLEGAGQGTQIIDTAYGGDSFVIVDATELSFAIRPDETRDIASLGVHITAASDEQFAFSHPQATGRDHIAFCLFAYPQNPTPSGHATTSAVAVRPGKVDRSPTGTALSARMALLEAQGKMAPGQTLVARSIIGSEFTGRIVGQVEVAGRRAIVPE